MRAAIFTVALLAAGAAHAQAAGGWQFAKWGMTPEQVIAASAGKATADPTQPRCPVRLTQAVTVSGIQFDSGSFCFEAGKLTEAALSVSKPVVFVVNSKLAAVYGQPVFTQGGSIGSWIYADRARGIAVKVQSFDTNSTFVTYSPIPQGL